MLLGKVVGQVVSTVRAFDMPPSAWLLVDMLDAAGNSTGLTQVAADSLGVGEGELVILVAGSSARRAVTPEAPVDLIIIGIVDSITSERREVYNKNRSGADDGSLA